MQAEVPRQLTWTTVIFASSPLSGTMLIDVRWSEDNCDFNLILILDKNENDGPDMATPSSQRSMANGISPFVTSTTDAAFAGLHLLGAPVPHLSESTPIDASLPASTGGVDVEAPGATAVLLHAP